MAKVIPITGVQAGRGPNNQTQSGWVMKLTTESRVVTAHTAAHRPYLALYEQVLYEDIQFVVQQFPAGPKRQKLKKVATNIRIPFNQTVRYPKNTSNLVAAESDDQFLKNIGKDNILVQQEVDDSHGRPRTGPPLLANLRERIWFLLNVQQDNSPAFTAFSTDQWYLPHSSPVTDHHSLVTPLQQQSYPNIAGFDPLFWLHNAAIDRFYALWQALHPAADQNWQFGVQAETQPSRNWWLPKNRLQEGNTSLGPFHRTETEYWDSNSIRDFKTFGYTYPELTEWNIPNVS
ncbi:hypothetical protein FPQ18DRAFT_386791 [Pyronema domesticum]|nr:hypothetical protein FPQ18DRAFT_386791 [Pyronema domesticum]